MGCGSAVAASWLKGVAKVVAFIAGGGGAAFSIGNTHEGPARVVAGIADSYLIPINNI